MGEIGIGTVVDLFTNLSELFAEVNGELATIEPLGDSVGLGPIDLQYTGPEVGVAKPVNLGAHWLPHIDVDTPYGGTAEVPTWQDVASWMFGAMDKDLPADTSTAPATAATVNHAAKVAGGTTLKAISGFVNQTNQRIGDTAKGLFQIDAMVASATLVTTTEQAAQIAKLQAQVNAILTLAIPSLQAQIVQANHNAYQLAINAVKLANEWSVAHVYTPLETQRNTDIANTTQQIQQSAAATVAHAHADTLAQVAPVAAAAATALATAKAVSKWVDDCGEPMCQTMGPKTDLGKFLKGLKLAGILAFLAEVAALDENGVEALIRSVSDIGAGLVDAVKNIFLGGGTLGSVAKDEASRIGADLAG